MSDCRHEHLKCMDCLRDITGGESHLTPITSVVVAPAVERMLELENERDLAEAEAIALRKELDEKIALINKMGNLLNPSAPPGEILCNGEKHAIA